MWGVGIIGVRRGRVVAEVRHAVPSSEADGVVELRGLGGIGALCRDEGSGRRGFDRSSRGGGRGCV